MNRPINPSRRDFLAAGGALIANQTVNLWADGKGVNEQATSPGQGGKGKSLIIDCHAHVGIAREPGTSRELSAPWETVADPELILQHAREAGIDKTVIFPINNKTYKEANEEIARICQRCPNVHLDTAAVVMTRYLEKAARELPAEQILFGSDEPEIDCRLEIFKIRLLNLPKEKEELILGGNIARLLGRRV